MQSGMRSSRPQELAKEKFEDDEGKLFQRYPIADDSNLSQPLPEICLIGHIILGARWGNIAARRKCGPDSIAWVIKCSR